MYLKQIEITGFKSFADKTRLQFEPGMIAIVGPNGCGKSNVSDAIRWVLGEQRPTALRCAKMPDVVFNGTDSRKPLGMAEVSITFADCEGLLDTEFNEVTITRRVFRSGEGQYFINKNLCRLKDVHRLFMGTGIGTTSYSVMAQGQIDAILSSKPEDRRAVFEEAAGITKFKADRKEALRKIEQTDANLLRLADVIREVKRQIGTLQRQAGKAQKYRELRDELRGLDIFLTRRRLAALDIRIRELDTSIHALSEQLVSHQEFVAEAEAESARIHGLIHETEERIAALTEQAAQADNRYIRAQEVIKVNEQRIAEYRAWAERDNREISETRAQIDQLNLQLEALEQKRLFTQQAVDVERAKLEEAQARFDAHKTQIDQTRAQLQQDRQQSVVCERRSAQIQQTLSDMEARQRDVLMKRDRLSSEHRQVQDGLASVEEARDEVKGRLDRFRAQAESVGGRLDALEDERETVTTELRTVQDEASRMQSEASAKRAQIDLLTDKSEASDEFAAGSKQLLDPANPLGLAPQTVLGPLADQFNAPSDLRLALEAALRAWLDAVVLRDAAGARQALAALFAQGEHAAARVVVADGAAPEPPPALPGLTPLLGHDKVSDGFADAARRLLGAVYLAETLDAVPAEIPAGCSVVTRGGVMFHADGCAELWMPDSQVSSPLARRMLVADTSEQLASLEERLTAHRRRLEQLNARAGELTLLINQTRQELDENRRRAAQAEGEHQTVSRDAERARARLETVAKELGSLAEQTAGDDEARAALAGELQELTVTRNDLLEKTSEQSVLLQELESVYGELSHILTECRIQVSSLTQQLEHAASQRESVQTRIDELERTIQGRNRGVMSYDESISRLETEIKTLEASLEPMRAAAEALHGKIEETRRERAALQHELEKTDATLAERRRALDTARDDKAKAEVEVAESRMRRQNQLDHIYNEYGLSAEELIAHADPAWEHGEQPPVPDIESRAAQLTSEIQALGPVNLVAIDEYKELEERYTFLRAQEQDLLKSKEQILELITMINKKSGEMFQSTFAQANTNFETMFTKLFNGGQAKLVLLENVEDPLECGIDIIARPPGKRPQSVTLLSGGERTMTAVSLLFAIFMIKPAPFCMLDELDAALDDSNIGRFVQALKDFLQHSQFLIITHNQHTIAGSDIVYGVTQQEKGISKIVSMRLKEIGTKELSLGAPAPAPTVEEEGKPKRPRKKKAEADAEEPPTETQTEPAE
ncbi:MAG: chromosome segregation protein SMC [Verrucomicrobiota bacterium]|nr:chromosome segregation protein SMC [Verrucomicrobiota bacterium]